MNRRVVTTTIRIGDNPWNYFMHVYENGKLVETHQYAPYMILWETYR